MLKEQLFVPEQQIFLGNPILIRGSPFLDQAHELMHAARLSNGGNIRDKTREDLEALLSDGGQIWGWVERGKVLSMCTLEPKIGDRQWWYINNGVTRLDFQGQGLNVRLLGSAIRANDAPDIGFIVIYVRQSLFERLGFREVTPDELESIDVQIAAMIWGKLRPGKKAHIFIK